MAVTHVKNRLEVIVHDATMLESITREWPEGASQTFLAGAPLKLVSGLALKFVTPTDGKLAGFALSDGHNVASGASVTVIPAFPHIEIECNFLGAAAADNVLAAADFGNKFDLLESTTLIGGDTAGWYISDATA